MLYELRTYTAAPGKLDQLEDRFRNHTLTLFEKHGIDVVGFWRPAAPDDQEGDLVYLCAFPDRAAFERAWAGFRADPEWIRARDESEREGRLAVKVTSRLLTPTDYSPMK